MTSEKKHKITTIGLWLILILCTAVLFSLCLSEGIDYDEAYSYRTAHDNTMMGIIRVVLAAHDTDVPVWYMGLRLWSFLVGDGIIAYKMFALLGTVLSMLLGPVVIRRQWGAKTAALYMIMVSLTPVSYTHLDVYKRQGEHRIFTRSLAEVVKKSVDKCRTHAVTTAVCLYGICALLSAICSPYGSIAWNGEREWYMGAVTICLMIGGFLLTAKYGGSCKTAIWLGEAAFVAVTLIGLLQKLGYDPLGLLKGYVVGDWEFTHMLTTLGNSNWLSGYYSVMFPFSMTLLDVYKRQVLK